MCAASLRRLFGLLVLLAMTATIAHADARELIREGRAACARDDHEEAIALYRQAIAEDPSVYDSIAVSLASQLTWAGRHAEAIKEFKRFLQDHLVDNEALLTLALAQFWDNRYGDALKTYRCVLHREPDNPDARFGEARMLAWKGNLGPSLDKFETLLRRESGHLDAALHRAMVVNWMSDHRRSAGFYGEILETDPGLPEALYGRAEAWNAAGLADRASLDLEDAISHGTNGDEATRLLARIRRAWSPGVRSRIDYLHDSDDFDRVGTRLEAEIPIALRLRTRVVADRNDYSKPGRPTTDDLWVGIGGEARVSEQFLLYGSSQALAVTPEGAGGTRGRGFGRLAWLPNDRVRIDVGYTRQALFTYERSPENNARYLDGDIFDAGLTGRPYWRTKVTIGHDRASFADGNARTNTRIRVRHDFYPRPRISLEAGLHLLDYDEDRGGGIWTPQEFRSYLLANELEWPVREDLRLVGRIEAGTARDRADDSRAHFTAIGSLRFQRGGLDLELRAGRADADVETGRGYRRTFATLAAGIRL